jgi:hypothetical protein
MSKQGPPKRSKVDNSSSSANAKKEKAMNALVEVCCLSRTPKEQVKAYMEALYKHIAKWLHWQALRSYCLHGKDFVLSVLTQPNKDCVLKTSLQVLRTQEDVKRLAINVPGFQRFEKSLMEVFIGENGQTDGQTPFSFPVAFTINDPSMRETHICLKKFLLNVKTAFTEARERIGAWEELKLITSVEPGKSRIKRFLSVSK